MPSRNQKIDLLVTVKLEHCVRYVTYWADSVEGNPGVVLGPGVGVAGGPCPVSQ